MQHKGQEFADQHHDSEESLIDLLQRFEHDMENEFNEQMEEEFFDNLTNDPDYNKLMEILGPDSEEVTSQEVDEDIEMVETDFQIPKDPITRRAIEDPVRNKSCKHIYERETFLSMFTQNRQ